MQILKVKNVVFAVVCCVMTQSSMSAFADVDPVEIPAGAVAEQLSCLREAEEWDHLNAAILGDNTKAELRRLDQANGGRLKVVLIARDASRDVSEFKLRESQGMSLVERANSPEYLAAISACRAIRSSGGSQRSGTGNSLNTESGQSRARCLRDAYDNLIKPFYPKTGNRLDFFHVGIAVKSSRIVDGANNWVMFHELKPCNSPMPNIYQEGIEKFFLDKPKNFRSLVLVPTMELQNRIKEVLLEERTAPRTTLGAELLSNRYNAIATAYQEFQERKDQNSNQWVLEVIAAAQTPRGTTRNRGDAQRFLRAHHYMPTVIRISSAIPGPRITDGLVRFAADQFIGSISTDNHPFVDKDMVELISVDSVEQYLISQNALMPINPQAQGAARFRKTIGIGRRYTERDWVEGVSAFGARPTRDRR